MHALTEGVTIVLAGLGNLVADIGALAQMMPPEWVKGGRGGRRRHGRDKGWRNALDPLRPGYWSCFRPRSCLLAR
jgi:hypothetical protein